ncbi:hypothetical protein F4824DRAFT_268545 [Ustulina deusta]|nr:hypothetical protein F4823DRAFT_6180 [Ustulina deusta]KAI3341923.1 hypothetical protein F4824DRAFT_268545 [Ustulina deusta]
MCGIAIVIPRRRWNVLFCLGSITWLLPLRVAPSHWSREMRIEVGRGKDLAMQSAWLHTFRSFHMTSLPPSVGIMGACAGKSYRIFEICAGYSTACPIDPANASVSARL